MKQHLTLVLILTLSACTQRAEHPGLHPILKESASDRKILIDKQEIIPDELIIQLSEDVSPTQFYSDLMAVAQNDLERSFVQNIRMETLQGNVILQGEQIESDHSDKKDENTRSFPMNNDVHPCYPVFKKINKISSKGALEMGPVLSRLSYVSAVEPNILYTREKSTKKTLAEYNEDVREKTKKGQYSSAADIIISKLKDYDRGLKYINDHIEDAKTKYSSRGTSYVHMLRLRELIYKKKEMWEKYHDSILERLNSLSMYHEQFAELLASGVDYLSKLKNPIAYVVAYLYLLEEHVKGNDHLLLQYIMRYKPLLEFKKERDQILSERTRKLIEEQKSKKPEDDVISNQDLQKAFRPKRYSEVRDSYSRNLWGLHSKSVLFNAVDENHRMQLRSYEIPEELRGEVRYDIYLDEAFRDIDDVNELSETIVAVIDTGIDDEHEDFQGEYGLYDGSIYINQGECKLTKTEKTVEGKNGKEVIKGFDCGGLNTNGIDDDGNGLVDDWRGYDFHNNDNNPRDGNGHGTHVSGTIAAQWNKIGIMGINPKAKILPLKALSDGGSGNTNNILNALIYAASQKARVVNLSLGGVYYSQIADSVYKCLKDENIVIVAAAGNSNNTDSHYPSDYDHVISVGASDYDGKKAWFSNYSAGVEIAAPGVEILSTWPKNVSIYTSNPFLEGNVRNYVSINGTSMASPHVAGAVSLLFSIFPQMSAKEAVARILSTATSVDEINSHISDHPALGAGVLNIAKAIKAKPRQYLKLMNSSEKITLEVSEDDFNDRRKDFHLDLESYWEDVDQALPWIELVNPTKDLELLQYPDSFSGVESGAIKKLKGVVKLNRFSDSLKEYGARVRVNLFDRSYSDYISIRIEPYYRVFENHRSNRVGNPSHNIWMPSIYDWGVLNEKTENENEFFVASITQPSTRFDEIYISKVNQNGDPLPGWPLLNRSLRITPELITQSVDLDGDGKYELFYANNYTGYLAGSVHVRTEQGIYMVRSDGSMRLKPRSDYTFALIATQGALASIHSKNLGFYSSKSSKTVTVYEGDLDHEMDIATIESINSYEHIIKFCDLNQDGINELIIGYGTAEKLVARSNRVPDQYVLEVRSLDGSLLAKKSYDKITIKRLECESLSQGQNPRIIFIEGYDSGAFANTIRSLKLSGNQLEEEWKYGLGSSSGISSLQIVDWKDGKKAVLANYNSMKWTAIDPNGKTYKGFPMISPNQTGQDSFLWKATIADINGDGENELVINEAADYVHLFSLDGKHMKTYHIAGNFWSAPLVIRKDSRDILLFTTHKGLQKVEYEDD